MINYGFGVKLDRIQRQDLDYLFKWRNDKRIYKWCRQFAPISRDGHERWFIDQDWSDDISMFAIRPNPTAIVGVCGLTSIDRVNRRAEFSCYIDPDQHKNGYGHMTLLTLFKHGFYDLGLNRIWGEVFDGNPALKLFEKIGMEVEGRRKEFYFRDGQFIDASLVSIGREQFDSVLAKLPVI